MHFIASFSCNNAGHWNQRAVVSVNSQTHGNIDFLFIMSCFSFGFFFQFSPFFSFSFFSQPGKNDFHGRGGVCVGGVGAEFNPHTTDSVSELRNLFSFGLWSVLFWCSLWFHTFVRHEVCNCQSIKALTTFWLWHQSDRNLSRLFLLTLLLFWLRCINSFPSTIALTPPLMLLVGVQRSSNGVLGEAASSHRR